MAQQMVVELKRSKETKNFVVFEAEQNTWPPAPVENIYIRKGAVNSAQVIKITVEVVK